MKNENQGKSRTNFVQPSGRNFQPSGRKLLEKNNHEHEEPESDIKGLEFEYIENKRIENSRKFSSL